MKSIAQRLEDASVPEPNSGCLLHMGADNGLGYVQMRVNGRWVVAHRLAWEQVHGPIPEGLLVCHKCDTRRCINPLHMFLGTYQDNNDDMIAKGRHRPCRGVANGRARLTEADVLVIRSDVRSSRLVAADYGVDASTIRDARNGRRRRWANVKEATQ